MLAKIQDPGHASLAVTAGSIAQSANVIAAPHSAIALREQPSPFTRSGPGFANSIKPDFVESAGNLLRDTELNRIVANVGTNVIMASGKLTPALQNSNGTSFAAPRVAHHLALINRDLRRIAISASAPLLRAFLAASAEIPSGSQVLTADENRTLVGYGLPNGFTATDCQNHSVLLYWQGSVPIDSNAIFRKHVPSELANAGRGRKRIIVSVASSPPVQAWGVEEYLGAEFKFRLYRGDRAFADILAALQRADGEENRAAAFTMEDMAGIPGINARSVGTLQRASFEWSNHDPSFSADDYTLAVSLYQSSWAADDTSVPLAVVVRIEDTTTNYQELYAKVRARARARA